MKKPLSGKAQKAKIQKEIAAAFELTLWCQNRRMQNRLWKYMVCLMEERDGL